MWVFNNIGSVIVENTIKYKGIFCYFLQFGCWNWWFSFVINLSLQNAVVGFWTLHSYNKSNRRNWYLKYNYLKHFYTCRWWMCLIWCYNYQPNGFVSENRVHTDLWHGLNVLLFLTKVICLKAVIGQFYRAFTHLKS